LQFISVDSPLAAAKVLDVVLAAAESLSVFAERGRTVPEVASRRFERPSSIAIDACIRCRATRFASFAVLHGAMDFDRWLRQA
jgi:plasmid stabilization system protein ParE